MSESDGIIDIVEFRRSRQQQREESTTSHFDFVDRVDEVCLLTKPEDRSQAAVRVGEGLAMTVEVAKRYLTALAWTLIHAECADCRTGGGKPDGAWCPAHETTPELINSLDILVAAMLCVKNPLKEPPK